MKNNKNIKTKDHMKVDLTIREIEHLLAILQNEKEHYEYFTKAMKKDERYKKYYKILDNLHHKFAIRVQ